MFLRPLGGEFLFTAALVDLCSEFESFFFSLGKYGVLNLGHYVCQTLVLQFGYPPNS